MSFEEVLIMRKCYECDHWIDKEKVYTETVFKDDRKLCRYFHYQCAVNYCKRQTNTENKK